jgi:hypothetical protein
MLYLLLSGHFPLRLVNAAVVFGFLPGITSLA